MDLLFINQMYSEMLQVSDIIQERQTEGAKYSRNVINLTFAACYKLVSSVNCFYFSCILHMSFRIQKRALNMLLNFGKT